MDLGLKSDPTVKTGFTPKKTGFPALLSFGECYVYFMERLSESSTWVVSSSNCSSVKRDLIN